MNTFDSIWRKFSKSKRYREEFVAAQAKKIIPVQIRRLLKRQGISQETLAERAGLTQGVVSRAANPEYGNLTLNTIIKIAAGFDVAFVGRFVPFTELDRWFSELSDESLAPKSFVEEEEEIKNPIAQHAGQSANWAAGGLQPLPRTAIDHLSEWESRLISKQRIDNSSSMLQVARSQPVYKKVERNWQEAVNPKSLAAA